MQQKYSELEQIFNNDIVFKHNNLRQLSQAQLAKKGIISTTQDKINSSLQQSSQLKTQISIDLESKKHYLDDYHKYLKTKMILFAILLTWHLYTLIIFFFPINSILIL